MVEKDDKPVVLIVDDEMQIRFYLMSLVKSLDFEPILAKDGAQGLDVLEDIEPRAIILDIMMPEKGGVLFYQDIMKKPEYSDIPIIFFSGVDRKAFFHHIHMLNASLKQKLKKPEYYVAKDADPEYLKSIVRNCVLGKKDSGKE